VKLAEICSAEAVADLMVFSSLVIILFPDATSNPVTAPLQMYHLGLWFDNPQDAAKAAWRLCAPARDQRMPIVRTAKAAAEARFSTPSLA